MKVVLDIPDETAAVLGMTPESASRRLLEDTVVEAYRAEKIGTRQLRSILGLSWHEKEELLFRHRVFYDYSPEELQAEVAGAKLCFEKADSTRAGKHAA